MRITDVGRQEVLAAERARLKALVEGLPVYQEHDVVRRPSTDEYLALADVLALLEGEKP